MSDNEWKYVPIRRTAVAENGGTDGLTDQMDPQWDLAMNHLSAPLSLDAEDATLAWHLGGGSLAFSDGSSESLGLVAENDGEIAQARGFEEVSSLSLEVSWDF